jgi:ABC-type polysaccharide/polyol phosphate transport system ATPase subunit
MNLKGGATGALAILCVGANSDDIEIACGTTILGMTKRVIESKLDQVVAFSGLEEFIDRPVKRKSSGLNATLGFRWPYMSI